MELCDIKSFVSCQKGTNSKETFLWEILQCADDYFISIFPLKILSTLSVNAFTLSEIIDEKNVL